MSEAASHATGEGGDGARAALWAAYRSGGGGAARTALVHAYAEFARMLAAKSYARRVLDEMEFDDYLHYAQIGLLESIDRYDASRGGRFESFAGPRINGAILNGIARASEIQEQIAARKRILSERTAALEAGTAPDADVFGRLAEIAIGLAVGFMLDGTGMIERGGETVPDTNYTGIELRQLAAALRAAVQALPERQRRVIQAHYVQQQAFDEIAQALQLSRGRVSQLHREGLLGLRGILGAARRADFFF